MSEYHGRYQRLDNVTVWTDGTTIIIEGEPPDESQDPDCEAHHCDSMGCGMRHILYRADLPKRGGVALGYIPPPEPAMNCGPSAALLRARERQIAAGNDVMYQTWMQDECP